MTSLSYMLEHSEQSMRYAVAGDVITCVSLGRMAGASKPVSLTIGKNYTLDSIREPSVEGDTYKYWIMNDRGLSRPYSTAKFWFDRPSDRAMREDPAPESRASYNARMEAARERYRLEAQQERANRLQPWRDAITQARDRYHLVETTQKRQVTIADTMPEPGRRKIRLE